jgi:hypothetical protein
LKARVVALQTKVASLSTRVLHARKTLLPRLSASAREAVAAATAAAIDAYPPRTSTPFPRAPAPLAAALTGIRTRDRGDTRRKTAAGRVGKLRADAAATRKRIGNVLDVLKIISESHVDEAADNTVTMTVDGMMLGINSEEMQIARDEPQSPLARAMRRASSEDVLALSPHITPRTKTRRRLLGSPHAAAGAAIKLTLPR